MFSLTGGLIKQWGRVPFVPGHSPPPMKVTLISYSFLVMSKLITVTFDVYKIRLPGRLECADKIQDFKCLRFECSKKNT